MNKLLINGTTGLTGYECLRILIQNKGFNFKQVLATTHVSTAKLQSSSTYGLDLIHQKCNASSQADWEITLRDYRPNCIVLISNIRHSIPLLRAINSLNSTSQESYSPKLIVVGTTGVFSTVKDYSEEYKSIELALKSYNGKLVLLRPSMIYGSNRDKNLHKVIKFIKTFGFYPIFGNGKSLMQPVHYKDLAGVIINALQNENLTGSYNIPGKYPITYTRLVQSCFTALQMKPRIVYIPSWLILGIIKIVPRQFIRLLPVTKEQVLRLNEDKSFDYSKTIKDLNYQPKSFKTGILLQIQAGSGG